MNIIKLLSQNNMSAISNELITSFKFATLSNVIFSGIFLENQLDELNISKTDYRIEKFNSGYLRIKNISDFELKENDIIFSRTEDLQSLFYILKNVNLKNIKLITHQSDISIDKSIFNKKSLCISKWFSVNVNIDKIDLIPIPIGISNDHPKNLTSKDFEKIINTKEIFFKNKSNTELLYVNFQKSTNFNEREGIYNHFSNHDWALVQEPSQEKSVYIEKLKSIQFTLTPFGNGVDTHRFWEALYCGSIPVVKKHLTYTYANELPVLFVDNYHEISKEDLLSKASELSRSNINLNKLFFSYWEDLILSDKLNFETSFLVKNKNFIAKFFETKYLIITISNSYKKIVIYYLKKLKKLIFYLS